MVLGFMLRSFYDSFWCVTIILVPVYVYVNSLLAPFWFPFGILSGRRKFIDFLIDLGGRQAFFLAPFWNHFGWPLSVYFLGRGLDHI